MSRIGKHPIQIPAGVTVEFKDGVVTVKGAKATLTQQIFSNIDVKIDADVIHVLRKDETTDSNAKQGLYRQLINNMVVGVKDGYTKTLIVKGVGYRVNKQGNKLVMNLGLSHPVEFAEVEGITLEAPDINTILVKGADKELVGEVAAKIRDIKKCDHYHGYGIRYSDEVLQLKPGKAAGKKK